MTFRVVRADDPTVDARSPSLMTVAVAQAGAVKGAAAMTVLVSWWLAEKALGHALGADTPGYGNTTAAVREYARYWRKSDRQAWRDVKRFGEAFPGEATPGALTQQLRDAGLAPTSGKQREVMAAFADLRAQPAG